MNDIHFDPAVTVAFSGHRPEKIFNNKCSPRLEEAIHNEIYFTLNKMYRAGFRNFISGMARGFDLWAAHAVMLLKEQREYQDIKLIAAIPHLGQSDRYDEQAQKLYDDILRAADYREALASSYYPRCYLDRNDWMLEHSKALICYCNGEPGGTDYTVEKAHKAGHIIINLHSIIARREELNGSADDPSPDRQ